MLITARVHVSVIVREVVIQDVQIVMGVVIAVVAMEVAVMAVILLVILQPTPRNGGFNGIKS